MRHAALSILIVLFLAVPPSAYGMERVNARAAWSFIDSLDVPPPLDFAERRFVAYRLGPEQMLFLFGDDEAWIATRKTRRWDEWFYGPYT